MIKVHDSIYVYMVLKTIGERFLGVLFIILLVIVGSFPSAVEAVDGEITYTGNNTGLAGDDVSNGPFNIGFPFEFYGTEFTQAYVNINGTVQFGGNYSRYNNVPLNTAISGTNIWDNTIYAFWDDLNTQGAQNIYYATVGTAPNRQFITQWTNIYFHGTFIQLGTFQVILYEGTNIVQLQYRDLLGGDRALGNSATIGLRKNNLLSHQYSHNTASLTQEQAIRYTPDGNGSYTVDTDANYELVYLAPAGAPTSPTLVNPTDGTSGVTLTPTFEWLPVESATSYTVLISTVSNFSSTIVNQSGITGTSYTPGTALNQNTNYYWRVQSVNGSGSSLSPTRSFTTGSTNNVPSNPADIISDSFIGGASQSSLIGATLRATLVDPDDNEQVRYRLQIATDSGFSDLNLDYRSAFGGEGEVLYTFGQESGAYLVGNATTTLPVDDYYLRIRAEDDAAASSAWYTVGGVAFSITDAPDTIPPVLSSIAVSSLGTSTATITWTTDENADSQIEYGVTDSYGVASTSSLLATSHTITLSGLEPATEYHYLVQSADSEGNVATSSDLTFTTESLPDTTAPGISGISVDPESESATIYWTTDEDASSLVEYGPSSQYVASTSEENTNLRVSNHEILIRNLKPCVTYHYRIISRDASNNEVRSNDNSFTTKDCVGDAVVIAQTATAVATSTGGTLDLLESGRGISLSVPASFSTTSAHFQIKKVDDTTARNTTGVPQSAIAVGNYTYELHAVTDDLEVIESFTEPIVLTLAYSPSDVEGIAEDSLKIYRWHNAVWDELSACAVDTNQKTVTCSTEHFSTFGLFGEQVQVQEVSTVRASRSAIGTSVNSRVNNLIRIGNVVAAEKLIKEFPEQFKNKTVIIPSTAIVESTPPQTITCKLGAVNRVLRAGSEGEDVRSLQQFLNCAGFTLDTSGAGSLGNETTLFSVKTYNALVKFQEYYSADILMPLNLSQGTGVFGALSKAKAEMLSSN